MDEKWRVSRVELLEGGLLYGFVLYDQKGRPSVSCRLCGPRESEAAPQSCCVNNDTGNPKSARLWARGGAAQIMWKCDLIGPQVRPK